MKNIGVSKLLDLDSEVETEENTEISINWSNQEASRSESESTEENYPIKWPFFGNEVIKMPTMPESELFIDFKWTAFIIIHPLVCGKLTKNLVDIG